MEYADYMRFFFALMFVVGLIGGTAVLARRFGLAPGTATGGRASKRRLEIVESLNLDTKRRMVIVRRDNQEHLILLGTDSETIVETAIERPAQLPAEVATTEAAATTTPTAKPSDDDDIFARLRKVAELMNEKRAQSLRTGRPNTHTPASAEATGTALRKIAGDRS
ncbi:MAG: FliO/MopB family protein [Candidatus Phaeomarinobacter sp.]